MPTGGVAPAAAAGGGAAAAGGGGGFLLAASIAATAAATIISVQQQRQQVKNAEAISEANAQIATTQAKEKAAARKRQGKAKADVIRDERRRQLSTARAKFGASGVQGGTGSPLITRTNIARTLTEDAIQTDYNTRIGVQGILTAGEQSAQLSLLERSSARKAGKLAVGASLFSGASQALSTASRFKKKKEDTG